MCDHDQHWWQTFLCVYWLEGTHEPSLQVLLLNIWFLNFFFYYFTTQSMNLSGSKQVLYGHPANANIQISICYDLFRHLLIKIALRCIETTQFMRSSTKHVNCLLKYDLIGMLIYWLIQLFNFVAITGTFLQCLIS